jgi:drug/metabolite transporter (DMT)-like permease
MHGLMLAGTFFWGANIVAGKIALHSVGTLALAQFRVLGAAILFATMLFGWHGRPSLRLASHEWGFLAVTALFGITLNQLFFIGGIGRTSAAHSGLIVAMGPVMVLILSCALRLEALTFMKSAGAVISFVGVAVLTAGKAGQGNSEHWRGDLLLFLGGAAFAYYTILAKEVANRYDAVTLNAVIFALGTVFMIPVSAREVMHARWRALPVEAWWAIGFMVIFGTALAYLIYAFALSELTAARVAAFAYLQPMIAAGLGMWLLGETLTASVVVGGALILTGLYLTERERGDPKPIKTGRGSYP